MNTLLGFLLLAVVLVVGGYVYFLPTIVASKRRHRNRTAITVLNVALGWTFLGWVAALVWANTSDVEPQSGYERGTSEEALPSWVKNPTVYSDVDLSHAAPAKSHAAPTDKTCPFCAETIKAAAIVCKHCGRDLPPPNPEVVATGSLDAEAEALGVIWSPVAERYMWRREFFKDLGEAVEYAKRNS